MKYLRNRVSKLGTKMKKNLDIQTPAEKAVKTKQKRKTAAKSINTAKWARTMTKWLITHSSKEGVKWQPVHFGGKKGHESSGIVDLMAIRKDHKAPVTGSFRGDLFEIVLIQVKGGNAPFPSCSDVDRLMAVKEHHNAKHVVLSEWKLGKKPRFFLLPDMDTPVAPTLIFGKVPKRLKTSTPPRTS
jgi:hypothetical protein